LKSKIEKAGLIFIANMDDYYLGDDNADVLDLSFVKSIEGPLINGVYVITVSLQRAELTEAQIVESLEKKLKEIADQQR